MSDATGTELDQRIGRALEAEEMKGERRVNHIRFAFSLLGLLSLAWVHQVNTPAANRIFAVQGVVWLVYSLVLAAVLRARAGRYLGWLKYVTITADLGLLSLTAFASLENHPGIAEYFVGTPPFVFVFWNLVSGFRLSLPAGLYSSALTALLNFGILYAAVTTGVVRTSASSISDGSTINVADQVVTIVVFSLPGVVAGVVAHTARRLLWRVELQTAERARLEKEKARLGRYLSPDLVGLVLEDPDRLELGGQRQTATIMFTDIQDFAPFSDSRDPEEVVRFLNVYFGRMVSIVFDTGGTLDKYIGDGLLAEYGVPLPVGDAPLRAVTAALEMIEALRGLGERASELAGISIGVGIATGPVVAGNIGSLERMEYTCVGATVNAAARLERLNREMGTNIIVCEETQAAIQDFVATHRLPPMKVAGQRAAQLYAVEVPDDVAGLVAALRARLAQADEAGSGPRSQPSAT
jgi:class 3 adenylate cyclase